MRHNLNLTDLVSYRKLFRSLRQITSKPDPDCTAVTFFPASHKPTAFNNISRVDEEEPALAILRQIYRGSPVDELLRSSLTKDINLRNDVIPQSNGFVYTVMEAYNRHRALIIRPDDVWLAILVQFNFFVNKNAELLRKHFVNHEGKKELIVQAVGNRYTVDFAAMSREMTRLMETQIIDPGLRDWIIPTFSTTTTTDTTIYAMVMMASLKQYFSYTFGLMCGIPQVTLEGKKEDWEAMLSRLDKLKEYGEATTAWYHLLRPVVSRFVAAYDAPHSKDNLNFWNRVAHVESMGSGPSYLTGWITAFCFFDADGSQTKSEGEGIVLDGVAYPRIDTDMIPPGYAEVDVKLDDNGISFESTIVAGSIATQIFTGTTSTRDTVRPLSAWWLFTTSADEVKPQI
ncbi:hypothetical protein APHAL10511_004715 [Amanita phalloides]|nr:hypothetical protein APHAL10511_004715 [Amanita phalloides]